MVLSLPPIQTSGLDKRRQESPSPCGTTLPMLHSPMSEHGTHKAQHHHRHPHHDGVDTDRHRQPRQYGKTASHQRSWSMSISSSARPYLQAGLDELYDIFNLEGLPAVSAAASSSKLRPSAAAPLLPTCSPSSSTNPNAFRASPRVASLRLESLEVPASSPSSSSVSSASTARSPNESDPTAPTLRQYHSLSSATRKSSTGPPTAAGPASSLAAHMDDAHRTSARLQESVFGNSSSSANVDPSYAFGLARSRSQNDRSRFNRSGNRAEGATLLDAFERDTAVARSPRSSATRRIRAAGMQQQEEDPQHPEQLSVAVEDARLSSPCSEVNISALPEGVPHQRLGLEEEETPELMEKSDKKRALPKHQPWSRGRLVFALTAVAAALFGLCAWQISRDPDLANASLVGFALTQPACASLSALSLIAPGQRRFGKTIYRPLGALCARLMRVHVLVQTLVACVALQSLAATASAKRRRAAAPMVQMVQSSSTGAGQNAAMHAHDSQIGSTTAQTQFLALFVAQVALPVAAALFLQYMVAREMGIFVASSSASQAGWWSKDVGAVESRGNDGCEASAVNEKSQSPMPDVEPWSSSTATMLSAQQQLLSTPSPDSSRLQVDTPSTDLRDRSGSLSSRNHSPFRGPPPTGRRHGHRYHHSVCLPIDFVSDVGQAASSSETTAAGSLLSPQSS
ncbi:hypothetical protein A4X13_0g1413 [Tilletia indica]|uniref:Uncharacterized protein n=1 Tax=Tilletia indica TaxID=43049 RepID=A0A177TRV2_9BASI|nr:hypothetical protein A4X13_0g1413 [Tilletia indica]